MCAYMCWLRTTSHVRVQSNLNNFIEIGRVVAINYGPEAGKLATVIDVVNYKRVCSSCVFVCGGCVGTCVRWPTSGLKRRVYALKATGADVGPCTGRLLARSLVCLLSCSLACLAANRF